MVKTNKLSPNFDPEKFMVTKRTGPEVLVRSTNTGKEYRRNVTHTLTVPPDIDVAPEIEEPSDDEPVSRPKRQTKKPKKFGDE